MAERAVSRLPWSLLIFDVHLLSCWTQNQASSSNVHLSGFGHSIKQYCHTEFGRVHRPPSTMSSHRTSARLVWELGNRTAWFCYYGISDHSSRECRLLAKVEMALLAPLDISTAIDAVAEQRIETDQDLDRQSLTSLTNPHSFSSSPESGREPSSSLTRTPPRWRIPGPGS